MGEISECRLPSNPIAHTCLLTCPLLLPDDARGARQVRTISRTFTLSSPPLMPSFPCRISSGLYETILPMALSALKPWPTSHKLTPVPARYRSSSRSSRRSRSATRVLGILTPPFSPAPTSPTHPLTFAALAHVGLDRPGRLRVVARRAHRAHGRGQERASRRASSPSSPRPAAQRSRAQGRLPAGRQTAQPAGCHDPVPYASLPHSRRSARSSTRSTTRCTRSPRRWTSATTCA